MRGIIHKCPTELHKAFMEYAIRFFEENGCKGLVKGSLYKDTAHAFSDIDLVIKRMDQKTVEDFICNFGEVALVSRTQRPVGIIIVIYCNGLCLDLDFRDKVTKEEIEEADAIGSAFEESDIADSLKRCEDILESDEADSWKSMQRLFHRSLIKWLGGKRELGYSILYEIVDFLKEEKVSLPELTGDYKDDLEAVLEAFNRRYPLNEKYASVIRELL